MPTIIVFVLIALILAFVVIYRNASGENLYKYIADNTTFIYDKFAPYTYQSIRDKIKDLGVDLNDILNSSVEQQTITNEVLEVIENMQK